MEQRQTQLTSDQRGAALDVHAHVVPMSILDYLVSRHGFQVSRDEVKGFLSLSRPSGARALAPHLISGGQGRSAWLEDQGITAQILSPWLDVQPPPQTADARDWCRRLNEAMADEAQSHGSVAALASVATSGDRAADDLLEAVIDLGMAGLVLSTNPEVPLYDRSFEPLWTAAADLSVPVMLHPPSDGPSRSLPGAADLGNVFCRLVDTTMAVAELVLSGLKDRHPGLTLILPHGGGMLPYQLERLDSGHRVTLTQKYPLEREAPSCYLRDLYYDTVALSPAAIRFLAETVGAEHVLLGTDFPFPIGGTAPIDNVTAAALSASDTQAVLRTNADSIFPMGPAGDTDHEDG